MAEVMAAEFIVIVTEFITQLEEAQSPKLNVQRCTFIQCMQLFSAVKRVMVSLSNPNTP